jgi:hypothetical protein
MVTPLINGVNYSFANITLVLFGVPVVGITKIDFKRKQKKENNYGFGQDPVSRGYGNNEYEGSMEIYLDEWKKIIQISPFRDPLSIAPFDIQIVYGGSKVSAEKDVLRSCEFMEDSFTANQGDTKLMVNVPLIIGAIER